MTAQQDTVLYIYGAFTLRYVRYEDASLSVCVCARSRVCAYVCMCMRVGVSFYLNTHIQKWINNFIIRLLVIS